MNRYRVGAVIAAAIWMRASVASVYAGPPLICHPIAIGSYKTLPAGDGPFDTDTDYDRSKAHEDALRYLAPEMPVVVRMETIRRATLYLTDLYLEKDEGRKYGDGHKRAMEAFLNALAKRRESAQGDNAKALALFDLGYARECFRQVRLFNGSSGYDLIKEALRLRGDDASMHFACALITLSPRRSEYKYHVGKAKNGKDGSKLLAENMNRHRDLWK